MSLRQAHLHSLFIIVLSAALLNGCALLGGARSGPGSPARDTLGDAGVGATMSAEKVDLYRRAETQRAQQLTLEIERLQADLRKAEAALIEAESGLAGTHSRADAVSSLAEARIEVERAAARAPWRTSSIQDARDKLVEAERQVAEGRFGAALFFVYRAKRVSESLVDEAEIVERDADVRIIDARRVNLRAGPSVHTPILSVLEAGTPVFLRTRQGEWILSQVSGGPTGWLHESLVGRRLERNAPAARRP